MADYYHGGRTMSYGGNTDECYDAGRHGHGHGHNHGGRTPPPAMMYSNMTTDECYDAGSRHGHGGRAPPPAMMYSNMTTDECYDSAGSRHGHGHGGGGGRVYSHTDVERYAAAEDGCGGYGGAEVYSEEYSRGGGGGEQGYYYKKEEKTHKNRERAGELGALATGAFAMYEGYEAKKDPAHAQRHKIEAGLAGAAAVGAGGYAYHEHREQKQAASYGGARVPPQHNHTCYNY